MSPQHAQLFSRRRFLGRLTLAGTAGLLGLHPSQSRGAATGDDKVAGAAVPDQHLSGPLYVTDELLRLEGFTDVQFVKTTGGVAGDKSGCRRGGYRMNFVAPNLLRLDARRPARDPRRRPYGCLELFGTEAVHTLSDLKGKTVALTFGLGGVDMCSLPASRRMWASTPIETSTGSPIPDEAVQLFTEGKVDALLGFHPPPRN